MREDAKVPPELRELCFKLLTTGHKNGISIPLMMNRFSTFERGLSKQSALTSEQKKFSDALDESHRRKVRDMNLE